MKKGVGLDSLKKELITLDRVKINDHTEVKVHLTYGNDILWDAVVSSPEEKVNTRYKGTGINTLLNRVEKLYKKENIKNSAVALCLVETKGKHIKYLVCELPEKEEYLQGRIQLESIEFDVSSYELSRCLETRLALYDGINVYPITEDAKTMVGLYTDAILSFKNIANIPLGSAMMLTEKLCDHPQIDILVEKTESRIKPLISICSRGYRQISQSDFILSILNELTNKQYFYYEDECYWSIQNSTTYLYIPLSGINVYEYSYTPVIGVEVSEAPGVKTKVVLYAKIGDAAVLLRSNKQEKQREARIGRDAAVYFNGFTSEMEDFEKRLNEKVFIKDVKDDLIKIIGQKRYTFKDEEVMTLREFIERSNCKLPNITQDRKLSVLYGSLLRK